MCGRYYANDELDREIEKLVNQIYESMLHTHREIYPSAVADVIVPEADQRVVRRFTWGFSHFNPQNSSVIFNARQESVLQKPMFKDSILHRRCIIPAAGYYEWNSKKDKYLFTPTEDNILLFAGLYKQEGDSGRYVILTTSPNESTREVHDRMPVMIQRNEMDEWLKEDEKLPYFLQREQKALKKELLQNTQTKKALDGQLTLF